MFKEHRIIFKENSDQDSEILDPQGLAELLKNPGKGSCGIAAIQSATGATREVVNLLLEAVCQNDIRAGRILDSKGWPVGDGAGVALRTDPDQFGNQGMQSYLHSLTNDVAFDPQVSTLHGGMFFLDPKMEAKRVAEAERTIKEVLKKHGLTSLSFQKANTDPDTISDRSKRIMPQIYQLTYAEENHLKNNSEEALFKARIEIQERFPDLDIVSLQPGTITFKGMLRGAELVNFYPDLARPDLKTDAGLVHTRFGTNTLARWAIAQPFGIIAHNGEVNSIRKILKVMENLEKMNAIPGSNIMKNASDSANLDRALQFLVARGLSLEESVRWMLHPPLDELVKMPENVRNYFAGISRAMGSLRAIGPIALLGLDRNKIIAALDNMGLRPLRIVQRADGLMIIASEVGMPHIDNIVNYDRVGAGEMQIFGKDGNNLSSAESNQQVVENSTTNYRALSSERAEKLKTKERDPQYIKKVRGGMEKYSPPEKIMERGHLFGLNFQRHSQLKELLSQGKDPVEGMGSDLALACFSPEPNSFARYTSAHWSQVSNPSLDYIREGGAFSTEVYLGARPQETETAKTYKIDKQYHLSSPLLDDDQMTALYSTDKRHKPERITLDTSFEGTDAASCKNRIEHLKNQVLESARKKDHAIIVLSDRKADLNNHLYIPPHILVAYISRELDKEGLSSGVSIVVDSGEVLDPHEYNLLLACGAKAVHPRTIYELIDSPKFKDDKLPPEEAKANLRKAFDSTLLRYMAKIGMTDIDAYRGSQEFSTIGLSTTFIEKYFRAEDVDTNGGGIGLDALIAAQVQRRELTGKTGNRFRSSLEKHGYKTSIMRALQQVGSNIVAKGGDTSDIISIGESGEEVDMDAIIAQEQEIYDEYLKNIKAEGIISHRDIYKLKSAEQAIPLDEVMPRDEVIKRLLRGAGISLGSINDTAHKAIHMLFNHYDSIANSGEGGVPKNRHIGQEWESAACRSIQVASGRFGQDIESLANPQVQEIEIKIGQGAKPGVGGHLPGSKTFPNVAEIRGVALGQDLISPPTNHDIYSIEDLEALIQRLGAINPSAKICVKVTSGNNVGTIVAGCTKAEADKVQISGGAGGTGAATLTDKFYTGLPAEFGIAYGNKTLVQQGIRHKVELGADGGIRTGEDILKLAAMGANTASLGTMLLISQLKCIFCKKCSTQTCPAYITRSTKKFLGSSRDGKSKHEYSDSEDDQQLARLLYNGMRTLEMLAEDIRKNMARMGIGDIDELVGKQHQFLELDEAATEEYQWLKDSFDHSIFTGEAKPIFSRSADEPAEEFTQTAITDQSLAVLAEQYNTNPDCQHDPNEIAFYLNSPRVNQANRSIILQTLEGIEQGENPVNVELHDLRPKDRNIGATLGCLIIHGLIKVPSEGIIIRTLGDAGLGYGTGTTKDVTLIHTGPIQNECSAFSNGGRIIIKSPLAGQSDQYLVGNTLAYGARGGDRFIQSSVGDRCCVRETAGRTFITGNTGKYFAEYKTGGRDIVLGTLGNAVAEGMSGGEIFVIDPQVGQKLSKDATITTVVRQSDLDQIHQDLSELYSATSDPKVKTILDTWEESKYQFKKIVAKDSYSTKAFSYIHRKLEDAEYSPEEMEALLGDLFEMCNHDIDQANCPLAREQVQHLLDIGLQKFRDEILPTLKNQDEEQVFMATQKFSFKLTDSIKKYLTGEPGEFLNRLK